METKTTQAGIMSALSDADRPLPARTIAKMIGKCYQGTLYRLRRLKAAGLVAELPATLPATKGSVWTLREKAPPRPLTHTERVEAVIMSRPGLDRFDLARRAGVSESAARVALQDLLAAGKITGSPGPKTGRKGPAPNIYYPTDREKN